MEFGNAITHLVSKEGNSFKIPIEVALMSELVKCKIEEGYDEDFSEILLPNVSAFALQKIIEFCEHYHQEPMKEIEKPLKSSNMANVVQEWYADYVNIEDVALVELIMAANYMGIKPLEDLTCATAASKLREIPTAQIIETLNFDNNMNP